MKSSGNLCCQCDAFLPVAIHNAGVNYIKQWRLRAGLTLQELGEALEPPASAGTIHSYESGARKASQRRLTEIAHVLKTTPGKLLDEPPMLGTPVLALPAEIIELWPRIAEHNRIKEAIALLRVIAEADEDESNSEQK